MKGPSLLASIVLVSTTATGCYAFGWDGAFLQHCLAYSEETFERITLFTQGLEQMQEPRQIQIISAASVDQLQGSMDAIPTPERNLQYITAGQEAKIASSNKGESAEHTALVSGKNLYILWESNETGNSEIIFRASDDFGETFADRINLSNSTEKDSRNGKLSASHGKVFVSWQEINPRNGTNEYAIRISHDEGQTFGPILNFSRDGAISKRQILSDISSYENPEYGLHLEYPSGWQIINGSNPSNSSITNVVGLLSPLERRLDNYKENVWISIDNLRGENITLESYSSGLLRYKGETLDSFRLLDYNTDSNILADHLAYRLVYSHRTDDGTNVKEMEIGTKIDDKIFYFIYSAEEDRYNDLLPTIQDMVDSFNILDK